MSDMPEKIWAWENATDKSDRRRWSGKPVAPHSRTEYTRSDLCIPLPTLPDEMEFIDGVFVLYQWEGHRLAFRIEDDRSWGFHLETERKNGTWHSYNMIPESLKALLGLPPGVKIYKMYRLNKEGNKIRRKG